MTIRSLQLLRSLLLVLLGGLLGASACQSVDSTAPASPVGQYIVVEGRAKVDPSNYSEKISWAAIFNGPLEASAQSPFDPSVADGGQRILMAEAAARRDGLRALSRRILALPDSDNLPLSQSVAKTPDLSAAFEKLIQEQSRVKFKTTAQEAQAAASIDGQAVLALFRKGGVAFQSKLSDLTPDEQQSLKMEAYKQAVEDLRKRLREQILAMKDSSDQPLSVSFEAHPERLGDLERTLLILQADTTKFDDDGTCHVESYFDPYKAQDLAAGGAPWWAFWR